MLQGPIRLKVLCVVARFCRLLLRLKAFRSITFTYLHDSNAEYSDAAV